MPSIDCRKHNLANQRHHHIYHQLPKVLDDATRALIPNVRLKYQTYDVTNYKAKHRSLINAKKRKEKKPQNKTLQTPIIRENKNQIELISSKIERDQRKPAMNVSNGAEREREI